MTYLEKLEIVQDNIREAMGSSDNISTADYQVYNQIIDDVMFGNKDWDDEYAQDFGDL